MRAPLMLSLKTGSSTWGSCAFICSLWLWQQLSRLTQPQLRRSPPQRIPPSMSYDVTMKYLCKGREPLHEDLQNQRLRRVEELDRAERSEWAHRMANSIRTAWVPSFPRCFVTGIRIGCLWRPLHRLLRDLRGLTVLSGLSSVARCLQHVSLHECCVMALSCVQLGRLASVASRRRIVVRTACAVVQWSLAAVGCVWQP